MKKQGSVFSGGCYKMVACRNISDYLRHGAGQSRQSLTRAFLTLVHGSNAAHHTRKVVQPSAAITRFIRQVIHTPAFQAVSKKGYPVQKDTQFLLQIIDTTQANRHSIKNILTEVVHSIKKEDVNTLYSLNNQYQHYAACLTKSSLSSWTKIELFISDSKDKSRHFSKNYLLKDHQPC